MSTLAFLVSRIGPDGEEQAIVGVHASREDAEADVARRRGAGDDAAYAITDNLMGECGCGGA